MTFFQLATQMLHAQAPRLRMPKHPRLMRSASSSSSSSSSSHAPPPPPHHSHTEPPTPVSSYYPPSHPNQHPPILTATTIPAQFPSAIEVIHGLFVGDLCVAESSSMLTYLGTTHVLSAMRGSVHLPPDLLLSPKRLQIAPSQNSPRFSLQRPRSSTTPYGTPEHAFSCTAYRESAGARALSLLVSWLGTAGPMESARCAVRKIQTRHRRSKSWLRCSAAGVR